MCGICGEIRPDKNLRIETVKKMCEVLRHRGPDDTGMVFFRGDEHVEVMDSHRLHPGDKRGDQRRDKGEDKGFEVGLGHCRLSIIDLSESGHQPMCNEDRSVWIVFNGEIYNFQTLRLRLEEKGYSFKSKSDTEVILHAYEEWGVECLEYLRGMFAFAIWDAKQRKLFLARDRMGKKPLVYAKRRGRFIFASEIKSILQDEDFGKGIHLPALHHYLTFQYVPSPDSIFHGIRKLPPAHYLLYDGSGEPRIERYWKFKFGSNERTPRGLRHWCDLIRNELEESVKLRLISDVPLGVFLSGGVDSSLIVGIMAKFHGTPIKTFSIGFEEKEFDELSYARAVSGHFSTEHHEFVVRPNAIEILPKLVWYYNEPFADASAIPTYYLAHLTRDYVKVILTGDAGDENFAGYKRYLRGKWVALFTRLPERIRTDLFPRGVRALSSFHWRDASLNRLADFMESLSVNQGRNYGEQIKVFNDKEKELIYTEDLRNELGKIDSFDYLLEKYDEAETKDLLEKLLYVDIHSYLPEDLLVKMDIATMANSVEARAPFLDHKFMEIVAGIPSHLKLRGWVTKFILKKAFSDLLPEAILKRRKMGFGVPVSRWLRKELKTYVAEILLDRRTMNRGYFRRDGIERLLKEHEQMHYDHSAKIWALLVLEIWFRVFMDNKGGSNLYGA